jgi:poly(ADP-ribose) glycohydrolase ARH3
VLADRFVGSLLGLALADALGARYEGRAGGPVAWSEIARGAGPLCWTDDTQMALALAESLLARGGVDPDDLARRWAEGMEDFRGYGPGTRELLRRVRAGAPWREVNRSLFPEGSLGNGAAMRAGPLGLRFHHDAVARREATVAASLVTHAHPLGIEGAVLVAQAVALALADRLTLDGVADACREPEYRQRLAVAADLLAAGAPVASARARLGHAVLAHESAVTAVFVACRVPDDFAALVEYVVDLGGDTDTIGAMAGAIFGARHGVRALPAALLGRLEARERLEAAAGALCEAATPPGRPEPT